jgi:Flp pilus assembly pilin Flp
MRTGPQRAGFRPKKSFSFALLSGASRAFQRLAVEESGQAITEYIMLMAVLAVAALTMSKGILKGIYEGVLAFGGQLEKDLKTGRMSVANWKN